MQRTVIPAMHIILIVVGRDWYFRCKTKQPVIPLFSTRISSYQTYHMDGKIPKFTVAIFLIFKMQLCPPDCHVLFPKTFKTYYLCQQGSLNSPAIHNHRRPNANKFVFVLPKWKVCESTTTNQKVHVLPTTTPIPKTYRTHNLRH